MSASQTKGEPLLSQDALAAAKRVLDEAAARMLAERVVAKDDATPLPARSGRARRARRASRSETRRG
jgi:hypothetical protein